MRLTGWVYPCEWCEVDKQVFWDFHLSRIYFNVVMAKTKWYLPRICSCNEEKHRKIKDRLRKNNCKPIKIGLNYKRISK